MAMTSYTLFPDCIHHMFEEGLCLSRTPGGQWKMSSINHVTRSEEQNRAFFKTNFKTVQPVTQVNKVNYGKSTRHNMLDQPYDDQPRQLQFSNNFRDTNGHPKGSLKKGPGQLHYKHNLRKLICYYCEGEHIVKDCIKFAKEKSRDKQKDTDVAKCYKIKSQMVCGWVTLPSMRHCLPGCQRWPTLCSRQNSY